MKSAYELAMERLAADSPNDSAPLSEEKKAQLAEIDERYKAKIAERSIFLQEKLVNAQATGNVADAEAIRRQLGDEKLRLEEEREEKKDQLRKA